MFTIPTFSDPFYTITVGLDGRDYLFEFRYNQRENTWNLSIFDTAGTALTRGVKVVCAIPLLRHQQTHTPELPQGLLMAIPSGTDDSPPGLEDFGEGKRVELMYWSVSELA